MLTWNKDQIRDAANIHLPETSLPLDTALQIALADLLHTLDIEPAAMVEHCNGELVAAYAAGGLSHKLACKVAYFRGKLAGELVDKGFMMSVDITPKDIDSWFQALSSDVSSDSIHITYFNGPTNITLSGTRVTINTFHWLLDENSIVTDKPDTDIACRLRAMLFIVDKCA